MDRTARGALLAALLMAAAAMAIGLAVLSPSPLAESARLLDEHLLGLLRGGPAEAAAHPYWLARAMTDLTALGSRAVVTLIVVAAAAFLLVARRPHAALLLILAAAGGMALGDGMKAIVARPRPDAARALVSTGSFSFPSGHAMLSAATYLTVAAIFSRLTCRPSERRSLIATALALSGVVGMSRIYLGVHYPSDVLAGWLIGSAWAVLCWTFMRRLQQRGAVEREVHPMDGRPLRSPTPAAAATAPGPPPTPRRSRFRGRPRRP